MELFGIKMNEKECSRSVRIRNVPPHRKDNDQQKSIEHDCGGTSAQHCFSSQEFNFQGKIDTPFSTLEKLDPARSTFIFPDTSNVDF